MIRRRTIREDYRPSRRSFYEDEDYSINERENKMRRNIREDYRPSRRSRDLYEDVERETNPKKWLYPEMLEWLDDISPSDKKIFLLATKTINDKAREIVNEDGWLHWSDLKDLLKKSKWKNFKVTLENGKKDKRTLKKLWMFLDEYWFYHADDTKTYTTSGKSNSYVDMY